MNLEEALFTVMIGFLLIVFVMTWRIARKIENKTRYHASPRQRGATFNSLSRGK